jgi:hypothetical protein
VAAEFVALADLLRTPVARAGVAEGLDAAEAVEARVIAPASLQHVAVENTVRHDDAGASGPRVHECANDAGAALRDARLFRARLADAFDDAAARLLRELASDVLARELRLAPCDLAELVRRARDRMPVVRVRVAACDVAACDVAACDVAPCDMAAYDVARVAGIPSRDDGVAVVEDSALAAGDAIVELAGGVLDARLGVRLATVLEAFA